MRTDLSPVISEQGISPATRDTSDVPINSRNYIIRHWQGDLSLAVSFWINLCLFGLGNGLLVGAFFEYPSVWPKNYTVFSILCYTVIILALAVQGWQLVGLWRSAKKHTQRGGADRFGHSWLGRW
jgi:hypothetical protein